MTETSALPQLLSGGRLVLAGGGKMGGAMLQGWLAAGVAGTQIAVVDPAPSEWLKKQAAAHGIALNPEDHFSDVAVLVVAVKPQILADAAALLKPLLAAQPLVVSVAAGKTVANLQEAFGDVPLVRCMPNTPAAVGRGITAAFAAPGVSEKQVSLATALLEAVGEVAWLDDEALMDAVTAVSGSGPAYVFHMVECLAAAARDVGLPDDLAEKFARATIEGAGELLHCSPDAPAVLRQNVTSPGGTTAAALDVLMAEDGLKPLMAKAVKAARDRSVELSG